MHNKTKFGITETQIFSHRIHLVKKTSNSSCKIMLKRIEIQRTTKQLHALTLTQFKKHYILLYPILNTKVSLTVTSTKLRTNYQHNWSIRITSLNQRTRPRTKTNFKTLKTQIVSHATQLPNKRSKLLSRIRIKRWVCKKQKKLRECKCSTNRNIQSCPEKYKQREREKLRKEDTLG